MGEHVPTALAELVRERAADRCEYCRMSQRIQGTPFHVEHVTPSSRGGATSASNLALACASCNLHKATAVDAADPETSLRVRLYNPRHDCWSEHFEFLELTIVGRTSIGRATVLLLNFNEPRR